MCVDGGRRGHGSLVGANCSEVRLSENRIPIHYIKGLIRSLFCRDSVLFNPTDLGSKLYLRPSASRQDNR